MTDETNGGAAAEKKTQARWQYFGRSIWPWRKDANGKSLFLRHAEYRTVTGDFFDGYEFREESPKACDRRKALDAKLAAKAAKAAAPKKRGPYKARKPKAPEYSTGDAGRGTAFERDAGVADWPSNTSAGPKIG